MIKYINSISNRIMSKYPTSPIYIESVPNDFIRPSFFISFIGGDSSELNINLYSDSVQFQIVYFGVQDEYSQPIVEYQYEVYETLKKLFNIGYIPIVNTNRVAKITSLTLDKRESEIYVNLTIELTEYKDFDGVRDKVDYENMQDIKLKM